jgi:hypothetical protein
MKNEEFKFVPRAQIPDPAITIIFHSAFWEQGR